MSRVPTFQISDSFVLRCGSVCAINPGNSRVKGLYERWVQHLCAGVCVCVFFCAAANLSFWKSWDVYGCAPVDSPAFMNMDHGQQLGLWNQTRDQVGQVQDQVRM